MKMSLIKDDTVKNDKSGFLSHVDDTIEISDLNELGEILLNFHITPATFRSNKRDKEHFEQIPLLHLDYDNGTDPSTIAQKIRPYQYVIAGSKNHLKDKGDGRGVVPRFHVFIPFDRPLTVLDDYRYGWTDFIRNYDLGETDGCGRDGCRYYFRHSTIIEVKTTGVPLNSTWVKTSHQRVKFAERRRQLTAKVDNTPPIVLFRFTRYFEMLKNELGSGTGRYAKRLKIAGAMKACGLSYCEADSLFCAYGGYGGKFKPSTLEKLM